MLKKLRLKFILVNMIIVACMLLVIFGLVFQYTRAELNNESQVTLHGLMQGAQLPSATGSKLPYFALQISIHGGVTVSGSSYYDLKDEAFIQELIQYVYTVNTDEGYIAKYDLRYGVVAGVFSQTIIFVDVSGHTAALKSLVQSCTFVGVVALAAFFLISVLLARWAVRPVEKAWQQQRQFVSDASHELKTPLTVIMSNAELLQSEEFEPEAKQQFASSILVMSHQMRSLVEGMLELARADNGQVKKAFEILDLSKEVSDTILPFEPVFFEKGLILENELQPGISVRGSRGYLRQVLEILLDNAAKYSAPGIVMVQLQHQGKNHCLLSVSNPGAPIDKKDLQKIFERFYRADAARSRTGNFGLGLPIARSIVEEHGGKIWAESNETGNRFCVLLPCNN
jgi:signal transduction histidine kinase